MRGRCPSLGIALATAVSLSSPLRTQTAQPAGQLGADAAGKSAAQAAPAPVHDINGIWMRHTPRGVDAGNGATYIKNLPEMTPWGQAKFKEAKDSNGGKYTLQDTNDPVLTKCYPPGVPRVYFHPYPFEFVQTPKYMPMLYEYDHQVRRIYTDGRPLPTNPDLTWMGTSVGHWEGDSTLVVDTIGFNEKTWLDRLGVPHSDQLHVVERFHRVDHDHLELQVTMIDARRWRNHGWGCCTTNSGRTGNWGKSLARETISISTSSKTRTTRSSFPLIRSQVSLRTERRDRCGSIEF